jgi:hypothetical protein
MGAIIINTSQLFLCRHQTGWGRCRFLGRLMVTLVAILVSQGCNLVSDSNLRQIFDADQEDFKKLATFAESDKSLKVVIRFDPKFPEDTGLSNEQMKRYQAILQKLRIRDGMARRSDFPSAIFFYAECQGSAISKDCKGYAYSQKLLGPNAENLDGLQPGVRFSPLGHNWYLFRDGG